MIATIFQGTLGTGPQTVTWNGTTNGAPLAEGVYELAFTVTDALGDVRQTLPVTIDVTPAVLTVVDAKRLLHPQRAGNGDAAHQRAGTRRRW